MTLTELLEQEEKLQFTEFNNQIAWRLGVEIKKLGEEQKSPIAIEIYAFGQVIFCYAMPGSVLDNLDWMRRKRNAVLRFGHSSLYIGEHSRISECPFEQLQHIDQKEYCAHGGSFPIRLKHSGLIGAATVSGLPQLEDHALIINALTTLLEEGC